MGNRPSITCRWWFFKYKTITNNLLKKNFPLNRFFELKNKLHEMELLEKLNWRYAAKAMNGGKVA